MSWKDKIHWTSVKAKAEAFKSFTSRNSRRVFVSAPKKAAQKTRDAAKRVSTFLSAKWQELKAWWKKNLDLRLKTLGLVFVMAVVLWVYVLWFYTAWYVIFAYYLFMFAYGMVLGAAIELKDRARQRREARETIGVDGRATKDQAYNTYRAKVKTWHPDTVASQATIEDYKKVAEEQTRRLNSAWEVLEGAYA